MKSKRIALFASGEGSNALSIIAYFQNKQEINVQFVVTNNNTAGIVESARARGIDVEICDNEAASDADFLYELCKRNEIDYIILAGYLRKIPDGLIRHYPERIINIHPALLPKFGGKGMYGMRVHQAVKDTNETETGITVHFVDNNYDEGRIIEQIRCALSELDTPVDIQKKVRALEHKFFSKIIEQTILS
jgi:phosphoribosylglycinamide formyltransferase-1